LIERGLDGYLIASVPALEGCFTPAKSMEALLPRIRELVDDCLEDQEADALELVGATQIEVDLPRRKKTRSTRRKVLSP
jgi:predicted RNase H-like HicB family nuclease